MPGYDFKNSIFSPDRSGGFLRVDYHHELDVLEINRYGSRQLHGEKTKINGYAQTSIKVEGHIIKNIRIKRTKEGEIIGLLVPNLSRRAPKTLHLLEEVFDDLFDYTPLKLSIRDFMK